MERAQEAQKQRDLDQLQADSRAVVQDERVAADVARANAAGAGVQESTPPTAMELAMRDAGVRPKDFPKTAVDPRERQVNEAQARLERNDISTVPDHAITLVSKRGDDEAKAKATAELERRQAVREKGPADADRPWAERLFSGEKITPEERKRAVELGFGYQRADGSWSLTRRAREFKKLIRESPAPKPAVDESGQQRLFRRQRSDNFVVASATAGRATIVDGDALRL